MLKHRVSNAGAHGPPPTITRHPPTLGHIPQQPSIPQPQAPKPPRVPHQDSDDMPPPPPPEDDDSHGFYQPINSEIKDYHTNSQKLPYHTNSQKLPYQDLSGVAPPSTFENSASYDYKPYQQNDAEIKNNKYPVVEQPHVTQVNGVREQYPDPYGQIQTYDEPDSGHYNQVPPVINSNDNAYDMHNNATVPNVQVDKARPHLTINKMNENEGIRIINERYDSLGNLSTSPQRSPLGSPQGEALSFTDIVMSQKYREGVTEQDLLQVDTFYRSHKSEVHVCGCLANMYFGSVKPSLSNEQWKFSATGIPLLLLDSGEHHRERKLYFILAEKGTGFTLWRDVIDNLTGYKTPNANFHTMHMSKDHTQLAGFSFDEAAKASEFYAFIEKLTSDPSDELLKIGKIKKKKSVKEKKKKTKLPKKTEISQPCCFVHVTKLDRPTLPDSEDANKQPIQSNEISQPFNFQHGTRPTGSGYDELSKPGSLLNSMVGSKLTLTSTSSVDSGLSDDRSTRTGAS